MQFIDPGFFPVSDPHGRTDQPSEGPRRIAGYDLDANRILIPEHIRAMPYEERDAWLKENGMVPAVEGGAYSMFEMMQPFAINDSVAVTTNAETILSQATILTLPANFFAFPGKSLWLHGMGKQSNVVTTPGTYTFRAKIGTGVVGDTLLAASGAMTPTIVAATDNVWWIDVWIKALTTGPLTTSLTLLVHGIVWMAGEAFPGTNALWQARFMPAGATSLANIANLNGNIAQTLTLTVTPTVTTGSITLRDVWVVAMN